MSTTPRNPRYFPRMKVRGSRRRLVAPFHRAAGSLDRLGLAAATAAQALHALHAFMGAKEDSDTP